MPSTPNLAPTILYTTFLWTAGSGGENGLNNGVANIKYKTFPVETYGASQIGLACYNSAGGTDVILHLYWQGDSYSSRSPCYEASLTAAAAAGGYRRFTASIAEILIPAAVTEDGAARGHQIWLPSANHFLFLGAFSDGAPAGGQTFSVEVSRQLVAGGSRNAQ